MFSAENGLVEADVLIDHSRLGELIDDSFASGLAERERLSRGHLERLDDGLRKLLRRIGGDDEAGLIFVDDFRDAGCLRADTNGAARAGLKERDGQSFAARRQDQDSGIAVEKRKVFFGFAAEETNAGREIQIFHESLVFLAMGAVTRDPQFGFWKKSRGRFPGVKQDIDAFNGMKPADEENVVCVGIGFEMELEPSRADAVANHAGFRAEIGVGGVGVVQQGLADSGERVGAVEKTALPGNDRGSLDGRDADIAVVHGGDQFPFVRE